MFSMKGIVIGTWDTGPWIGFKTTEDNTYSWLATGQLRTDIELQTWKHACFTLDMETGNVSVYANGKLSWAGNDPNIVPVREQWNKTFDTITAGCAYDIDYVDYSMHGEVTDLQMYSGIMDPGKLIALTACNSFETGDLVNWRNLSWKIRGAKQTVLRELKSLENNVCHKPENTLHLLPFKLKTPELRKTCKKLFGRLHGYNDKDEFGRITKFMTSGNNIKAEDCMRRTDNTNSSFRHIYYI
ncbi:uncharacterized protein LOC111704384 [Eurytemora carolleeae]|uniref:uncharacterized protein LOC111704384 n=1 Tax=Eurytemora carolleeae TaxID=1294199 RepID=UPI000C786B68|nr:uncharacterized protein LOC111704384 [Eurytemora carolleeae]|eukprot:XP_023332379.1 uncharacterized protein LOC111704384 [Eurytemora affinis]